MRFRKLIATALATGTALVGGLAAGSSAGAEGNTLADILAAQGGGTDSNWYDFDILAAGVGAAGLTDALADPNLNATVFIPNDRAFQALVADLFGWKFWFANEATILQKVVEIEAGAPGTLATVITYHVVPGAQIDSATALSVPRGTELTTLQGGTIKVFPIRWAKTAVLVDQDRNDIDPFLVRSKLDIRASNGIAHGISFVLRPVDL
jgi:uncharacterized surface protein with fasciclin (FAS1) repeats